MFTFNEVTDLDMEIEFSKGEAVVEFKQGDRCRELFIIYRGPNFHENKEENFKQLKQYLDE